MRKGFNSKLMSWFGLLDIHGGIHGVGTPKDKVIGVCVDGMVKWMKYGVELVGILKLMGWGNPWGIATIVSKL